MFYRMKIIVKRIPCHDDQIRLQFVDPFYKAFQKNFVCVIAQMPGTDHRRIAGTKRTEK